MSGGQAVAQIIHHVDRACSNWTRNGEESWRNSGCGLIFFQGSVERVVAKRKGHAVVGIVHHAINALGALFYLRIPWRNRLIESALLVAGESIVAVCVWCVHHGMGLERERGRTEGVVFRFKKGRKEL